MKKLFTFLLALIPLLVFGAAGDIKIDTKNSTDTGWISTIFAKQNNAVLGTGGTGVPQLYMTTGSGSVVMSTGAAITAITGLGIRSTGSAFDLTLASSEVLTAGRTLNFVLGNAPRTLTIFGSTTVPVASQQLTFAGPTSATTITFPDAPITVARTDAANTFTGHQTIEGVTSTGATGTGNLVFSISPTLTGSPIMPSITGPANSDLTISAGATNQNVQLIPAGTGVVYIGTTASTTNTLKFQSGSAILDANSTIIDVKRAGGTGAGGFAFWDATNTSIARVLGSAGTLLITSGNGGTTWATLSAGQIAIGATTSSIIGAAGNMTITAGTGNSRTLTLQSTTSGGTATTFLVGNADQTTTLSGKISSYNGVATAGWGAPAIYKTGRVTAQSAANASISTYTVGAADGSFEVSANMNVTASTALSTTLTCTYTDESNTARTMIFPVAQLAGSFIAGGLITGTGSWETPAMHIRCKASTAITILTSAGTFNTVTYTAEGIIKQTN